MDGLKVRDAAALMGVSDDTVRRWVDQGQLRARRGESGRLVVDGPDLARMAREQATQLPDVLGVGSSARNRLVGLVTDVVKDGVMAEVTLQCGPFSVVSLMSRSSADSLGLEPGSVAVAVVKATTVIVETPAGQS